MIKSNFTLKFLFFISGIFKKCNNILNIFFSITLVYVKIIVNNFRVFLGLLGIEMETICFNYEFTYANELFIYNFKYDFLLR